MTDENNLSGLSINDPITETAGVEAVLGMINPVQAGQVENDSVPEAELEEDFVEESVDDEVEETLDQTEDDELEESDEPEMSGDIELDDSEYDYLVSAKEFLNENGLDDIDKIKSGILMQGDYTRKTQALAEEKSSAETLLAELSEQHKKESALIEEIRSIRDAIDEKSGLLVPVKNVDEIIDKCGLLIEDEVKRRILSCNARRRAEEKFSDVLVSKRHEELYKSMFR